MSVAQRVSGSASYKQHLVNKLKVFLDLNPTAQKYFAALSSVGKGGSASGGQGGHSSIDKNGTQPPKKGYHRGTDKGKFGFFFDIDGVFLRGKSILPEARSAFELMFDRRQKWKVPAVFVTNAGGMLKRDKAEQLSELFGVKVHANQVVMCHSPLRQFVEYHHKHVLVVGQGPVKMIARNLGFSNVTTIEDLMNQYPRLNVVDMKRRRSPICAFEEYNHPIEAILMFNEPLQWEVSLQLLLDILLTGGQPYKKDNNRDIKGQQHIPILACNMDLVWMAESPLPRIGHGAFLLCMESLYEKLTDQPVKYKALVGKPSEITYRHAERVLNAHAENIGIKPPLKRIYCVGDNPETDIMGANLYNRYLSFVRGAGQSERVYAGTDSTSTPTAWAGRADSCQSILVCTGVYHPEKSFSGDISSNYTHRDFADYPQLKDPTHVVKNVLQAVEYVLHTETDS